MHRRRASFSQSEDLNYRAVGSQKKKRFPLLAGLFRFMESISATMRLKVFSKTINAVVKVSAFLFGRAGPRNQIANPLIREVGIFEIHYKNYSPR